MKNPLTIQGVYGAPGRIRTYRLIAEIIKHFLRVIENHQ